MSSRPVLPWWIADFIGDTVGLTTAETGAYLLLLGAAWLDDGSLPNDNSRLARLARAHHKEWKRLRPAVMKYWTLGEDGRWRQKRLTAELEKASRISDERKKSGKKGGRRPVDKSVDNPVETCGQLALDAAPLEGAASPGNFANEINGHQKQLVSNLNPRSIDSSSLLVPSGSARANSKNPENKKAEIQSHQAAPARKINYRAARAAWETELANCLGSGAYAEALDYLATDPTLCERATAAEQRTPGTGLQVAVAGLTQHVRRT